MSLLLTIGATPTMSVMADTPPRHLPPKKEVALALLEGDSVFIHLDPRKDGVLVPKNLGKQAQLVLQVGLNLAIRIPDLNIDDEGVSCTLSFNRAPFWCRMPWTAIYALVGPDGRGMLWPEDVPPEVAEQMRAGRGAERAAKPGATAKKPRPRLTAVTEEPEPAAEPPAAAEPPRRPSKRPASRPALVPSPSNAGPTRPARAPLGAHHRPSSPGAPPPAGPGRPSRPEGRPPERAPADRRPPDTRPETRPQPVRPAGHGDGKKPKRELPPYLRIVK